MTDLKKDNRDMHEMEKYYLARIETLERMLTEAQEEIDRLVERGLQETCS